MNLGKLTIILAFLTLVSLNIYGQSGLGTIIGHAYYKVSKKEFISVDTLLVSLLNGKSDTISLSTIDSRFQINNLTPGIYTVICTSRIYGTVAQEVKVGVDFPTFVEVNFAPSRKKKKK